MLRKEKMYPRSLVALGQRTLKDNRLEEIARKWIRMSSLTHGYFSHTPSDISLSKLSSENISFVSLWLSKINSSIWFFFSLARSLSPSHSSKNKYITPAARVLCRHKTPRSMKEETRNIRATRINGVIYIERPFISSYFSPPLSLPFSRLTEHKYWVRSQNCKSIISVF